MTFGATWLIFNLMDVKILSSFFFEIIANKIDIERPLEGLNKFAHFLEFSMSILRILSQ